MKKVLGELIAFKNLTREDAREIMLGIGQGRFSEAEITAFITVYLMRTVSITELQGFRDALLDLAVKPEIDGTDLLDIVGTGGDGKNTFNISTLSCFIVAGTGNKVAKHGNYGSSSISGSSNVLEELGYNFKSDTNELKRELEQAGICFLHAPLFHPALKAVAGIRKNLGFRTFFNMLGPLVNPVSPGYSMIGVYNAEIGRIYNYLLQQDVRNFSIVHSLDGYDEISLTSDAKIISRYSERIMTPEQLGKRQVMASDISGGNSVKEAASIFLKIIRGEGSWAQNAVVIANAALALYGTNKYNSYEECYQLAVESLESGRAYASFKSIIS